jgi:hypothetical protein
LRLCSLLGVARFSNRVLIIGTCSDHAASCQLNLSFGPVVGRLAHSTQAEKTP